MMVQRDHGSVRGGVVNLVDLVGRQRAVFRVRETRLEITLLHRLCV